MNISGKHDVAMKLLTSMQNNRVSLSDVSKKEGVSISHLEGLAHSLRKSGMIISVRGPGGGYELARPLDEIMLVDVLKGVGMSSGDTERSPLFKTILTQLSNTTVADVTLQHKDVL